MTGGICAIVRAGGGGIGTLLDEGGGGNVLAAEIERWTAATRVVDAVA